jgi:uroporphyrinogen decarboxylase
MKSKDTRGGIVSNPIIRILGGESVKQPPIWMMRQAGRYLPEYREVRAKTGGFVDLCLTPALAAEVTLQPVHRFPFDAAIIFSDILIVPHALGVKLWFEEGEGPRLEPVANQAALQAMRTELDCSITGRVYEAISKVRAELPNDMALIGFCGAPWTVASYMVAGRGTPDQQPARKLAESNPALFSEIIDRLVDATALHLIGQLEAGADLLQLFDTWAGVLDERSFEKWCVKPSTEIVRRVRAAKPDAKIILFPKGISIANMQRIVAACGADAISIDMHADRKAACAALASSCAIQGNLDPDILIEGGTALDRAVDEILADFRGIRHIFNLGHGIKPETPIENVERMIARVKGAK